MSKLLIAGGLLSIILDLLSCSPDPKGPPLVVEGVSQGDKCVVTVQRRRVTQPQLLKMASAGPYNWALVRMQRDLPYKCVGAIIITLQQAGFMTVKTEELPTR